MMEKSKGEAGKVTVSCQFCLTLNRVDVNRVNHSPKCGNCGRPILLDRPIRVTNDDFRKVVGGSDVPVLVDFYADWCGPCKVMAPVLDDFARAHIGEALVAKLDTDMNQTIAQDFGIRSIPTLIVFKNGAEVDRRIGAVSREELEKLFASA
ncbi:MAG: thioredoxin TrxC [Gemmatimonadales bacterium]|jgi:thioredoxin 2